MRTFALKNADTGERYSLMSVEHYFSDPKGLGTNYDISGANTGRTFVITNKQRAINAPSGNMIFANYDEYNKFIAFCNCKNLQFCYSPSGKEYMMDISLASCEKTEAAENGMLTCPVTFNGLSLWYTEEFIEQPFKVSDSTLDHATFTKDDLLHIGKAGHKSEISIEIDFAQVNLSKWWLMEMALVYDDIVNGETQEMRKLFVSLTDQEFGYSDENGIEKNDLFIINSEPQNLNVQKKSIVYDEMGANMKKYMTEDLYKVLLPCELPPFICTDKDVYLFVCAVPDESAGAENIVGVKARCKRFVESV